jgi:DNA sulfur modification protein DndC
MKKSKKSSQESAFEEHGFKNTISMLLEEIQELYLSDEYPWIVGYSGGKDSTATLELVWLSLLGIPPEKRTKPVHIISTDTLVENPIVALWVRRSLKNMRRAAENENLPIYPQLLNPEIQDTFWVNLIGRGYPAPRPKFRWCTLRLKINPSNKFISSTLQQNGGEGILVLGMRKAESTKRKSVMNKLEEKRTRARLSPNKKLLNSYVYTPIEHWTNDDVWLFLLQKEYKQTPWGLNNEELFSMYKGANPDNECPLVVDTGTPSCGSSRFGCWVCTLVDKDHSLHAMVQNDDEKKWMLPLLELRDELGNKNDRHLRDFRRMSGFVQLFHDRPIPGPYKQYVREEILRWLLEAQKMVRQKGPPEVRDIELITLDELNEIRRIWVFEKRELEDSLPGVYEEVTGLPLPDNWIDDNLVFGSNEMNILRDLCSDDDLHYQLTRDLLDVERRYRMMARRAGLYDALEQIFRRSFYEDEEDATDRALRLQKAKKAAQEGDYKQLSFLN